tara:strand:+ start:74 stop:508 length:435 start_codon:yes stop_codon:yes gene_type:complete
MENREGFITLIKREISRYLSVSTQTVVAPLIMSLLYILIFGYSLGSRISSIDGITYLHLTLAYMISSMTRGLLIGVGTLFVSSFFIDVQFVSIPIILFFAVFVSMIFSLFGIIVGVYAKTFEHMSIFQTYLITPMIYLGGIFSQ